jgi:hypothetical protein
VLERELPAARRPLQASHSAPPQLFPSLSCGRKPELRTWNLAPLIQLVRVALYTIYSSASAIIRIYWALVSVISDELLRGGSVKVGVGSIKRSTFWRSANSPRIDI